MLNPFDVTKAVDFTDKEIEETYVEFLRRGGRRLADPASKTSQLLVGGKGGGRTHLMRHMAYSLQRLRGGDPWLHIQSEGYIGVYLRASGLNGTRFSGRGVDDGGWRSAFAYYMDVTLVEQLALALKDLEHSSSEWTPMDCSTATSVLYEARGAEIADGDEIKSVAACAAAATTLRKQLDRAINEVAFTRTLGITNSLSPGELVFRFAESLALPAGLRVTYLIDEFENFSADQQLYVNTLLREKRAPVTFLIGSRIYGIRTRGTLSSEEANKRGAEYDWVVLEDVYRSSRREYEKFCVNLVTQRLRFETGGDWSEGALKRVLEFPDRGGLATTFAQSTVSSYDALQRPHLRRLRSVLDTASGVDDASERAVEAVQCEEEPLVEKLAIHRFYQEWNKAKLIDDRTFAAAAATRDALLAENVDGPTRDFLDHWRADMLAQLQHANGANVTYAGIGDLIKLSGYLPRNLFVMLKNIVREASFQGLDAFRSESSIPTKVQSRALVETARWFAEDALPEDEYREPVALAMRRLGKLLERFRFSDKPSEVEVACFTTDLHGLSPRAQRVLEESVAHGLLLEHKVGRSARNNGGALRAFQLHPLIASLSNLPLVKRGEVALKPKLLEAIFNEDVSDEGFGNESEDFLRSNNAPFSGGVAHQVELF